MYLCFSVKLTSVSSDGGCMYLTVECNTLCLFWHSGRPVIKQFAVAVDKVNLPYGNRNTLCLVIIVLKQSVLLE